MGTAYVLAPAPKPLWGLLGMEKQINQLPTPAIWSCPEKYIIPEHRRAWSPSVIEAKEVPASAGTQRGVTISVNSE